MTDRPGAYPQGMPETLTAPPEFLAAADIFAARTAGGEWRLEARADQQPPEGDWWLWLLLAGRGFGKTWVGSRWLAEQATRTVGEYAVIGRSEPDVRATCIEGESGLLGALGLHRGSKAYRRGTGEIELPNGSLIRSYSAESPQRVRGPNFSGVWCDELAAWRFLTETWTETLLPAVRIGDPHIVVTTTPRPVPLLREFLSRDDGSVVVTRGTTFDNPSLSPRALAEYRRFDGTRIGRQELMGELLDDVEGALWTRELIEASRAVDIDRGELVRVVVGVDPAVTSSKKSDETGIVVCGIDRARRGYVLDDLSLRAPPSKWARQIAHAYEKWSADRIICESNQGQELLDTVLQGVDASLPFTRKHTQESKQARAEPMAALYEQEKISHVGSFPELEDQMCTWIPRQTSSPDRVDALCWALWELKPGNIASSRGSFFAGPVQPSRVEAMRPGSIFGA